jgi:UDP-N-acetyl-D-galactosamine dehydrogenase
MPLLTPLESASRTVGRALKPGDIVVYESTVWPGMTEEYCVPILEQTSGLVLNEGFTVGYSPERINPGDKCHTVETITKITSGSTPEAAEWVDRVYASVLQAGTYRAPSIKVAEAAKVLENTQRDVNIAVMNQASVIFDAMGIDSYAVLEAAGTKWNFLPFRPGLVGGHCIGVDPYYLIERAKEFGVDPKLFIEARRTNEAMAPYVAQRVIQQIGLSGFNVQNAKILLLGITFKENCSDIRNTKVVDVYNALNAQAESVVVFDPWADPDLMHEEYGIQVLTDPEELKASKFDAIVHAVNHDCFKATDWSCYLTPNGIYYDLKAYNPPPKSEPECTPQKAFAVQCEPKQMVQDATRFVAAKNPEQKHHHRTMLG